MHAPFKVLSDTRPFSRRPHACSGLAPIMYHSRSTEGYMQAPVKTQTATLAVQRSTTCMLRSRTNQLLSPFNRWLHACSGQDPISHHAGQHSATGKLRSRPNQPICRSTEGFIHAPITYFCRSTEGNMQAPFKTQSPTTAGQQRATCKLRSTTGVCGASRSNSYQQAHNVF